MNNEGRQNSLVPDSISISLIIISKNNYSLLKNAVKSIEECDYPKNKLQLIVLEETDSPNEFPAWVHYYTIPMHHKGFGYARNKALKYAAHTVIVFTDDDCIVKKDWLRKLIKPLMESEEIIAVSGAIHVPPCGAVGQCENILGFPGGGMRYVHQANGMQVFRDTFSTCNCAIRKKCIDNVGGFDESMKYGGEDESLSRKIGKMGTIVFQPDAIVYHKPRDSIKSVFFWFVRRGYADVYRALINKNGSGIFWKFLKNAVLVRLSVIVILSILTGLRLTFILPVLVLYYCYLLSKFKWSFQYYPSIKTYLMIPVVRTVMDFGRDWGIVKGLLKGKCM